MTKRELKKLLRLSVSGVNNTIIFAMIAEATAESITELDAINIALNISRFLEEKMKNKP